VAASHDGRWVYVTGESSNTITVIDAKAAKVAANILVDTRPRGIVFTRDGARAFVTCEIAGSVNVIDAKQHRVLRRIKLGKLDKPVGVVLSPDERRLYVATGRGDTVLAIDTASLAPVASVRVGTRPWGIALTADGRKLYTANGISEDVSVVETATMRVVATIKVPGAPWGVANQARSPQPSSTP